MSSLGDIVIGLRMDASPFARGASQARGSLSQISASVMGTASQFAGMLGIGGGAAAGLGLGVKLAADAEQTQIAFEVMMGSAENAKAMLASLKDYADHSPFDSIVTNESAKKLLNYGIQGQDILPTIRMLGDVAAGDANKFDSLATAFGQMSATGRLMGQDLNQFINAGFNPLQAIAKSTGESMADLKKRMEEGGISSAEVARAFQSATSAGGQFFGMTERQSQTISGKFSTLKDGVNTSLMQIGQSIITNLDLSGALDNINAFVQEIPFLFNHAGDLIELAIIHWQLYLYELIPGAETAMQYVGATFVAGFDASGAAFDQFLSNVKNGLLLIQNMASATWNAISAGIKAISQGQNPLTASMEAFKKTVSEQQTPQFKHEAVAFAQTFSQSFNQAMEGFQEHSLGDSLRDRQKELLKKLEQDADAAANKPQLNVPGQVGASFNDEVGGKKKKEGSESQGSNTVALQGTREAAEILLRGAQPSKKTEALLQQLVAIGGQQLVQVRKRADGIEVEEVAG